MTTAVKTKSFPLLLELTMVSVDGGWYSKILNIRIHRNTEGNYQAGHGLLPDSWTPPQWTIAEAIYELWELE